VIIYVMFQQTSVLSQKNQNPRAHYHLTHGSTQTPSSYRSGSRGQLHQLVRAHCAVIQRGQSVRTHRGAVRDLSGDSHADRARSVHRNGHVGRRERSSELVRKES